MTRGMAVKEIFRLKHNKYETLRLSRRRIATFLEEVNGTAASELPFSSCDIFCLVAYSPEDVGINDIRVLNFFNVT